jgi:tetratricopeptide (TPR) repeat protein
VLKINPRPAVMHYVMGVWLDADRRFPEARQHLDKAIEYAPAWPAPRVELGRLFMEIGEDSLARKTLDEAFELDTFDASTHSILSLLDTLEKFARLETEHFVIKYDDQADGIIAPYFAESLEAMYPAVCRDFGAVLDHRTIIEVFPDHMGFSLRTAGRPFIATVGACTGRVITLSAPRRTASVFGRFDWVDVLRHEFTHTVTMAVTDNRIPHWFTEGLAVREERPGQSWALKHTLSEVVRDDRLFTMETIDWGFVRPREPGDRGLAYAQSEWMVEYIVERSGERAIVDLLGLLREGKTQEQAFTQVLKCSTTQFDGEFKKWAAEQVARWNLPMPAHEDSDDIEAKLADAPDDPALLARLANAQMFDGDFRDAEETAQRVLEADENNKPALGVLCHMLIGRMLGEQDEGQREELTNKAEPYLRRLIEIDPENPSAIKYLGYVEQSRGNWSAAVQWLTRYQKMFPDDPDSYRRLAAIYFEQEDTDRAKKQLELLYPLAGDEPSLPRRIAEIYGDRQQPAEAATWLRRVLESDLYDVAAHKTLGEDFLTLNRPIEAEREFQSMCRLAPDDSAGYAGLVKVYEATGDAEKAAQCRLKADQAGKSGKPTGPGAD